MSEKKKILIVSMPSIHVVRWIENIADAYEIHWFDVLNRGPLATTNQVIQHLGWKKFELHKMKGMYSLRKYVPGLYYFLASITEKSASKALLEAIDEIQPDLVQSFNLQNGAYPILKAMNKRPGLPWMLNCWGNDLYYFQNISEELKIIKATLARIDYFTADCHRDYPLAKNLGFNGIELPMIPGGGGYHLAEMIPKRKSLSERKVILIKGYHHIFGRALRVLEALDSIEESLKGYEVVVFGAHPPVEAYVQTKQKTWKVYGRHDLKHEELLNLMGRSLIYVGNNISDGMPNTLLEAMIMGAFPIQSNPGGATAEVIDHGKNGLLIEDPEDSEAIAKLIQTALSDRDRLEKSIEFNKRLAEERLAYGKVRETILKSYDQILGVL